MSYAEERREEAVRARLAEERERLRVLSVRHAARTYGITDRERREVDEESQRQVAKWGEQNHDDGRWSLIFQEELGEAAKDMMEERPEAADKELIEAATVILQWVASRRRQRARRTRNADF